MQTHQFAVSAKEGADNYLNYLEETGRGHEEIKVDRIEREDTVYLLYLSKNPFSTETVHIVIGTQEYTQKEIEVIEQDTERDNFMTAAEAAEYGLIDKVITKR